jgi:hypothetical protein
VPKVQSALADLPWVDKDNIEIKGKKVRLTITDMKQLDEKKITERLEKKFGDATILK